MEIVAIIKKLRQGDQEAFRGLVFMYTGKLMTVAKIYTRNLEDAQDVLQDGFILIFQNIKSFNYLNEEAFLAWMRKIVMNEALKKYRKMQYKMENYNLDYVKEPSIEPTLFINFEKNELIQEIHCLPLRYKQVVCLFALEGYSHKEIGKLLGIESSSSRATYSRAKTILQKKMNPNMGLRKEEDIEKMKKGVVTFKKRCI